MTSHSEQTGCVAWTSINSSGASCSVSRCQLLDDISEQRVHTSVRSPPDRHHNIQHANSHDHHHHRSVFNISSSNISTFPAKWADDNSDEQIIYYTLHMTDPCPLVDNKRAIMIVWRREEISERFHVVLRLDYGNFLLVWLPAYQQRHL